MTNDQALPCTVQELIAEDLGGKASANAIYEEIRRGNIRVIRIGRKILIPASERQRLRTGEAAASEAA